MRESYAKPIIRVAVRVLIKVMHTGCVGSLYLDREYLRTVARHISHQIQNRSTMHNVVLMLLWPHKTVTHLSAKLREDFDYDQ